MGKEGDFKIVYIRDIVHYNEYDFALKGGYFYCPNCNKQQYVESTRSGEIKDCYECNEPYTFKW